MHSIFSALGEETRLRIFFLCKEAELTLTDLCQVLAQSQPRVSRHLRILRQAGLLEKHAIGQNMFFRAVRRRPLTLNLIDLIEKHAAKHIHLETDTLRMHAMLDVRATYSDSLARNISTVEESASFSAPSDKSAFLMLASLAKQTGMIGRWLDIGCGSGELLAALAAYCVEAVGIDRSKERIAIARTRLTRAGHKHCSLRLADLYSIPSPNESFDFITLHRVLNQTEDPERAVTEAARLLTLEGTLAVIDYTKHSHTNLRDQFGHRWLGFTASELSNWAMIAGLGVKKHTTLSGDQVDSHLMVFHKNQRT